MESMILGDELTGRLIAAHLAPAEHEMLSHRRDAARHLT